jgi:dTDP-4-amino-4,6-dideoxygalactose transaminase
MQFVDLYAQYHEFQPELDAAIANVIGDSAFIGGKYVTQFEEEFADYIGVRHCIGVANGTDAIEIVIQATSYSDYTIERCIVPTNTAFPTGGAAEEVSMKPLWADCDDHGMLGVEQIERTAHLTAAFRLTAMCGAVIPVHLYGQVCNMDNIMEWADEYGTRVIEDCSQAHGATWQGRKVGSFGFASTFSFYPTKPLGCMGDGGAICTNDDELAACCRRMRNHGRLAKHDHELVGRNSRLDGLQAAILSVKLKHLDEMNERRRVLARAYDLNLPGSYRPILIERPGGYQVYHQYIILTERRDEVRQYLAAYGIPTAIHYPYLLHQLPVFHNAVAADSFENAEYFQQHMLSLPIYYGMSLETVYRVCDALYECELELNL